MPMNGQASGAWVGSSSSLRLLNIGIRNANSPITEDAFTQTNPPVVATSVSTKVNTNKRGVLSGSIAFSRPDEGSNYIGGPVEGLGATLQPYIKPVGVFMFDGAGVAFMNQPSLSTGMLTYLSGQGTYGNSLYETQALATNGALTAGDNLEYQTGQQLIASRNGYLMPDRTLVGAALVSTDVAGLAAQRIANGLGSSTIIGTVRQVPDSVQNEVVYDQTI